MTGVEILATEQVATAFGFNWTAFGVGGALLGLLLAFLIWCVTSDSFLSDGEVIITVIFGFLIGFGLFGTLLGVTTNGAPTAYETRYKVIISDEVPMNEFLERYEIVNQEGKIYTVREVE